MRLPSQRFTLPARRTGGSSLKGFTLIEVLITAFVLSVVTVAITGLALVITRVSIESERATVAQGLLNEKLENLRAAYNELGYEVIAYSDESPLGMVDKEVTVTRNNLDYLVHGFITLIDDPANGTLPEGTPLTDTSADYAQVLYKASWTSNVGSDTSHRPVFLPSAYAAPSSVVSSATFFNLKPVARACTPGTKTCPAQRQCTPGAPAACLDEAGELTRACPPSGVCSGEEFWLCPASGKCSEAVADSQPQQPAGPQPPSQSQCPNGVSTAGNTLEVCDLSACGDGVDNDGDGGFDTAGIGNNPADKQCQEGLTNALRGMGNFIYVPLSACVVNEATCSLSDRGLQLWGRLGTVTSYSGCTASNSCGIVEKQWLPCATECSDGIDNDGFGGADANDPDCHFDGDERNPFSYTPRHNSEGSNTPECTNGKDDDGQEGIDTADPSCDSPEDDNEWCPVDTASRCQAIHQCNEGAQCTADAFGSACTGRNCCPAERSICVSGYCFECSKNNREACPRELCDPVGGNCDCVSGKCVQCTAINAKDEQCIKAKGNFADVPQDRPYCSSGRCVECIQDGQCSEKKGTRCRVAKYPMAARNTCQTQCNDGIDNDGDGTVDKDGLDVNGDGKLEKAQDLLCQTSDFEAAECSDGQDNDGDGLIDFGPGGDPQCLSADDPSEGGELECSDRVDNDFDGKIDFDKNGDGKRDNDADPQCSSALDPTEGGFGQQTECSDGKDNDKDGTIDFAGGPKGKPKDPDCTSPEDDREQEDATPACTDNKDNDGDGKVDFVAPPGFIADPGCISPADDDEVDNVPGGPSASPPV